MRVLCSERFMKEVASLNKNRSHRNTLNTQIKSFFLSNSYAKIATGDMLYGPEFLRFLKKRIPTKGGFRFYYLADDNNETIYLEYVHPKTGHKGVDNIDKPLKKEIHLEILRLRRFNPQLLYEISVDKDSGKLKYEIYVPEELTTHQPPLPE